MFAALGRFTYRARIAVLALTAVLAAAAAVWGSGVFGAVSAGGFEDPGSESARAAAVIEEELGHDGTDVVAVRVYEFLTARFDVGAAAAQALVLAVILMALLGLYFAFFGRKVQEESS